MQAVCFDRLQQKRHLPPLARESSLYEIETVVLGRVLLSITPRVRLPISFAASAELSSARFSSWVWRR